MCVKRFTRFRRRTRVVGDVKNVGMRPVELIDRDDYGSIPTVRGVRRAKEDQEDQDCRRRGQEPQEPGQMLDF